MINEVILSVNNGDGTYAILDLYENEKLHLNFKFTDITDFSAVGNYSREFRIPASKTNVDFFGAIYNVNFDGWFDYRIKTEATLTSNTIPIATGHIQVKRVYWSQGKLFEFEVVFFGEVPNLSRALNEKMLRDISTIANGDLDYELLYDNVASDPNPHTILSLCDKFNLTATNPEGQPIYYNENDAQYGGSPLYVGHLTPSVKAKYLFDQILADANISYASDYLDSILDNVYVPFVNSQYLNQNNTTGAIASNLALASNINNITLTTTLSEYSLYTQLTEYEDASNSWSSGIFTAPSTGTYTFRFWLHGSATRNNTNTDLSNTTLTVLFLINDSLLVNLNQLAIIPQQGTATATNVACDVLKTFPMNAGDTMKIVFGYQGEAIGNGAEPSLDLDLIGNGSNDYTGTGIELQTVTSQLYGNVNVFMKFNAPEMKQIDFIKSIQQMFNLVFVPDKTLANTLRIEPMNEYIASGNTLDWTQKLDVKKDIVYSPTTDLQKKKFTFTYSADGDLCNKVYQDNGRVYGRYEVTENDFDVINDFATGEEKIELAFASTPSNGIDGSDVVVPKFLNESGEFVMPKPRILYYFANFNVQMYDEVADDIVQTSVKCLNNYSTMNAGVNDLDLNFAPEVPLHTIIASPYNNLYNRFWRNYYREIYDGQARLMEGYFALTLEDIFTFSFADKIWIVDSWWRVLDIEGYVLGEMDTTKVKLIRVLDIDNSCDAIPVSANLDKSLNWEDSSGNPAEATEDCCRRYGYFWNSANDTCYSIPASGTKNLLQGKTNVLAPKFFGDNVKFTTPIERPIKIVSTDYAVTRNDNYILTQDLVADITLYVPNAEQYRGQSITFKNIDATYGVTLQPYGSQKIDDVLTYVMNTTNSAVTLISDGSNWYINNENDTSVLWTIELIDVQTIDVYAPYDMSINTIDNVVGAPTITITDDAVAYTLGNTIAEGSLINITASVASVINLNIEQL
jgi:hypothetical protein